MNNLKLNIKGMHCRSCEILIEEELKKVPGVRFCKVNYQKGIAEINHEGEIDQAKITNAIKEAGYSLGTDDRKLLSDNPRDYQELGIIVLSAMIIFLLAQSQGWLTFHNSFSSDYSSLPIVFLIGITAGVSTCMALVGGLVLGAAARFSEKHPSSSSFERFKPHIFFNIGRIISYFVLGGVVGYFGSLFQLSTSVLGLLTIAVGGIMLLLGGQLIDISPALKKISFTLPKSLNRMLGIKDRNDLEYSHKNAAIVGGLTFFLPCGFTQAMQLYAMSTGSPLKGALTMGVFALGTAPGLLGVGGLTSVVRGTFSRWFFKTSGVVVILLALFNIQNGINLIGVFSNPNSNSAFASSAEVSNGVQEVKMTQNSGGYSPNTFTVQKDIPVRWIINSENNNTCAASIVSQKLGIRKTLQLGENIIEFTPSEIGTIKFSCSMGMFTGSFKVVDQNTNTNSTLSLSANGGGCGCGGEARKPVAVAPGETTTQGNTQLLKATYTSLDDISPNKFTVKVNQPVRFEIAAQDDGQGCMGSVTIPKLTKQVDIFTKGQTIVFEFTPASTGTYNITCAMGVPRGQIQVI